MRCRTPSPAPSATCTRRAPGPSGTCTRSCVCTTAVPTCSWTTRWPSSGPACSSASSGGCTPSCCCRTTTWTAWASRPRPCGPSGTPRASCACGPPAPSWPHAPSCRAWAWPATWSGRWPRCAQRPLSPLGPVRSHPPPGWVRAGRAERRTLGPDAEAPAGVAWTGDKTVTCAWWPGPTALRASRGPQPTGQPMSDPPGDRCDGLSLGLSLSPAQPRVPSGA